MNMKKMIFVIPLLALLGWAKPSHAVSVSGYFDMEYIDADSGSAPFYRQHHLNLMLAHEVDIYKFFSEIEFEDAPDIDYGRTPDTAPVGQGRVFVERAYADAMFSNYFNLRMGQMLHSSLYYENHYPSLTHNITDPSMVKAGKRIFARNIKGISAFGEIAAGAYYGLWTGRGPSTLTTTANVYESGTDMGYRIGYKRKSGSMEYDLAYKGADYHDATGSTSQVDARIAATGLEMSLTAGAFTLWAEMGSTSYDVSPSTNDQTTFYAIASYAINLGDKGEISPFVMMDSYETEAYTTAKKQTAVGVSFKPLPNITYKAEYLKVADYNDGIAPAHAATNQYGVAFVYFYN